VLGWHVVWRSRGEWYSDMVDTRAQAMKSRRFHRDVMSHEAHVFLVATRSGP